MSTWDGLPRVADYRRVGIVFVDAANNELVPGCPEHEALVAEVEGALLAGQQAAPGAAVPTLWWEFREQVLS